MIRALFGFVMTIALAGAAALWALGLLDPVERLQGPPPVSRTVELLAADLAERLPPLPPLRIPEAVEAELPTAGEAPNAEPDDETTGIATLRARDEVVEDGDRGELRPHPLPLDPSEEDRAIAAADVPPAGPGSDDPGARREALADSAILVRRMLGLYQQALDPE